jgi:uncharacterized protein (TIGR03118 family)
MAGGKGSGNIGKERSALPIMRARTFAGVLLLSASLLFATSAGAQYNATNLVGNTGEFAPKNTDPNLVDGWGLAALPAGQWWLSAQNTSTSPVYSANGTISPLLVDIPCVTENSGETTTPCPFPGEGYLFEPNNPASPPTPIGFFGVFGPTGIVANTFSNAFVIKGTWAPAQFLFATQDGLIVGWNPMTKTRGVVVANEFSTEPTVLYQGLAIAGPFFNPHLYAANAVGGIDVFDKNFNLVNTFFPETSLPAPIQPAGPYGIQVVGDQLYVTYFSAVVSAGVLDVCDLGSSLTNPSCRRLYASNLSGTETSPVLASPWGIALAPFNFGPLSNMLLVGNVDDGLIHAFDPDSGHLAATLNLGDGKPFAVPGLWGLQFGNGSPANGPRNNLFFAAGPSTTPGNPPNDTYQYDAGLFGVIKP